VSPGDHTGVIPLQDANVIIKKQNNTIDQVVQFQIETRFRIFFLRADTEEDLDQWVQIIQRLSATSSDSRDLPSGEAKELRRGFLVKRDRLNKLWKKRYFVLSVGILSYFRTEQDETPIGMIPLESCSVNIADESLKRKNCFVLSTRFRNYFLEAADQFDMAGWIECIRFHSELGEDLNEQVSSKVKLFNQLNGLLAQHDKEMAHSDTE